jgi:adenosylhomocysteine nucleosidase
MEDELPISPISSGILVHMGIGKVNAAWHTARALIDHEPDLVVNFGTAGSLRPDLSGLVEVGVVMQRDMDARALGFLVGQTLFEIDSAEIRFSKSAISCGTGDSFAATPPELLCDLVDMELYAIAKI